MHTAAWRGALAVITVAVLTTSTGCSSVPSRDSEDSELLKGLSALAEANGNDSVIYLDAAKARKLSKDDPKRYRHIARPGGSLLSRYDAAPWGRHLKATQIDVSVDTAQAGHWEGTRLPPNRSGLSITLPKRHVVRPAGGPVFPPSRCAVQTA
ncbi:hypothetical protein [Streptomyces sp. NPDC016626]|uniref:hypothetical protein n=1 Tax=Streptomyces sp. NPDC016626 TaxID=3364968 RepID=UPI0036FD85BF